VTQHGSRMKWYGIVLTAPDRGPKFCVVANADIESAVRTALAITETCDRVKLTSASLTAIVRFGPLGNDESILRRDRWIRDMESIPMESFDLTVDFDSSRN
jgi:hypothetical protein